MRRAAPLLLLVVLAGCRERRPPPPPSEPVPSVKPQPDGPPEAPPDARAPAPLVVEATGRRFRWTFTVAGGPARDELVVPAGRPITLRVTSADVLHALYIPALRIRVDAVPGRWHEASLVVERPGTYDLRCAEYCGEGFREMVSRLRALTPPAWERWREGASPDRRPGPPAPPSPPGSRP